VTSAVTFRRPPASDAAEPPEHRGLARNGIRLLVAAPGRLEHRRFGDLPSVLAPGDLVVVNTSATLPAALTGVVHGRRAPVHVAGQLDAGTWVVEIRRAANDGPQLDLVAGTRVALPGGATATLLGPFPAVAGQAGVRLWLARVTGAGDPLGYLQRHGGPIAYGYLRSTFPLTDRQTVFARHPGSAEMPSAGRPFTERLVVDLVTQGVAVAPVVLHCGVSSPELSEPPAPERYAVPPSTARLVNAVRAGGGRVVAVGTTVVRALETCADTDGTVGPGDGWTDLVLGPDRPARAVTGLVTGLHEAQASHLLLLEAVAGRALVDEAYAAVSAGAVRYLWHEFGDAMLLLPEGVSAMSAR
jgi:S-adenosylmethionine:tRNA ribosyltransferase-isomerase